MEIFVFQSISSLSRTKKKPIYQICPYEWIVAAAAAGGLIEVRMRSSLRSTGSTGQTDYGGNTRYGDNLGRDGEPTSEWRRWSEFV